jgi:hypothetical protein
MDQVHSNEGNGGNVVGCPRQWHCQWHCHRRGIFTGTATITSLTQLYDETDLDGSTHDGATGDIKDDVPHVFISGGMWRRPWGALMAQVSTHPLLPFPQRTYLFPPLVRGRKPSPNPPLALSPIHLASPPLYHHPLTHPTLGTSQHPPLPFPTLRRPYSSPVDQMRCLCEGRYPFIRWQHPIYPSLLFIYLLYFPRAFPCILACIKYVHE